MELNRELCATWVVKPDVTWVNRIKQLYDTKEIAIEPEDWARNPDYTQENGNEPIYWKGQLYVSREL